MSGPNTAAHHNALPRPYPESHAITHNRPNDCKAYFDPPLGLLINHIGHTGH